MKKRALLIGLAGALLLAGCEEKEPVLVGKREDIRSSQTATPLGPTPVSLAQAQRNSAWPQAHGTPRFRTENAALSRQPQLVWSAPIGEGDSRKLRLNTDPVVAAGRIFTMDANASVMAHSTDGAPLWQRSLVPPGDDPSEAMGGGMAFDQGRLYVASGYGLLSALDAASGAVIWQQRLGATGSGSPTVADGLVYLVAGDDTAWALDANTGRIRWQLSAPPDVTNVLGAPAPVLSDDFVIFAYGGGEIQAAFRKGGLRIWDSAVAGQDRFSAAAKISDITGAPVLAGGRLFLSTFSGRSVAINPDNGERLWTAPYGALSPLWANGSAVFLVSERNMLVRLNANDGRLVWSVPLPLFTENRAKRQSQIYAHHGPILAGGLLWVASSDGALRGFDPVSGALTTQVAIPDGATTQPVVANGTLYVVSRRGELHAFR